MRRRVPALGVALMVAAAAFVFRFNMLGGTLGGFDNDEFAHLLRADALLRGEQPLRDFADAELRGAWPSLSYAVPAWAQRVWGRNLLAEAYLTAGALALAYAVTFLVALDLSRRHWIVALLAALLAIATTPKLYNYPKVLSMALGAASIRFALAKPSNARLAVVGGITAMATLFRHDYGVYLACAMTAGIVARDWGRWRDAAARLGLFAGATVIVLLPSLIWIQWYEGVVTYLLTALRTSGVESSRTTLRWPVIDLSMPFDAPTAVALTYYIFWTIPVLALAVLIVRRGGSNQDPDTSDRPSVAALATLAIVVNVFFLRSNLAARFGDAVIPVALLAAWLASAAPHPASRLVRVLVSAVPVALFLLLIANAYVYGELAPDIQNTGLTTSSARAREQFRSVALTLSQLPAAALQGGLAEGKLRAAQYLSECTSPSDRVLVAAYAPEVSVFAQRGFAGGQPTVSLSLYTSEAEQQETLARWDRQSVPIVLVTDTFESDFVGDYPLLARRVAMRYHEAGVIPLGNDERFRVFVENDRPVRGTDTLFGLPCFRRNVP